MEPLHRGPMAGRTVLVTGGTGGIGKATALGLATMGAHLAICGRDRKSTEGAARELRAVGGGQVEVFVADLSDQSQVRRLAEEVLERCSSTTQKGSRPCRSTQHTLPGALALWAPSTLNRGWR